MGQFAVLPEQQVKIGTAHPRKTVKDFPMKSLLTAILIGFALISTNMIAASAQSSKDSNQSEPKQSAEPAYATPVSAPYSASLAAAVNEYKLHPDSTSWDKVQNELTLFLTNPTVARTEATSLFRSNPSFHELKVRVIDAGSNARIWLFPQTSDKEAMMVQWQQTVPSGVTRAVVTRVRGRKRVTKVPVMTNVSRVQAIVVPQNIAIKEGRVVHTEDKAPYLMLSGNDKISCNVWLGAFKLAAGQFTPSQDILSSVPQYFLENLSGKATFSGSDLVFNVSPKAPSSSSTHPAARPLSTGYKVVFHLIGGRYIMEGSATDEGPQAVVHQFVRSLQQGRVDLAKALLVDPKLASIPKYVGVIGHPGRSFKLIAMTSPAGIYRFRMITFEKNDLIFEVARTKSLMPLMIKAIFVAPPDPLAQKLVGSSQTCEVPVNASVSNQDANPAIVPLNIEPL